MNTGFSPYIQYMYGYPHKTAYRTLYPSIELAPLIREQAGKEASLYFHIPFCRRKCGYCNLFSRAGCPGEMIEEYLDTLLRQAEQLSPFTDQLRFTSFAIGGGTPLLLSQPQMGKVMDAARLFGVDPAHVFTAIETSPDASACESLNYLKEQGVQRLSIGIQSFRTSELKELQRNIPVTTIYAALEEIASIGFPRFNIDLIYGIKGQTVDSLLFSIREALLFNPTELFVYPLYVRPGTTIRNRAADEECLKLYFTAREELLSCGFRQTSMRRFVKTAAPDLEYSCGDETMISCGCGGRSYLGNLHTATPYAVHPAHISRIIREYINAEDFTHINHGILLTKEEEHRRFIIKNLLYYKGLHLEEYRNRYGNPADIPEFTALIAGGYAEKADGYLRLTTHGMAWSDYVGQLFISPAIRELMNTYE